MTQTGESPVVPVSDRDLDEVLRSLELETLFPDLAPPRQTAVPAESTPLPKKTPSTPKPAW
jgi:hypothetical protein